VEREMIWESSRVGNIQSSATIDIAERIRELKKSGSDVIDLISGSPEFDTPVEIKQAASDALNIDYEFIKYTPSAGLLELREAIVGKLDADNQMSFSPDDVIVTVGVKEGLTIALQACLEAGDEVLLPTPNWVTYEPLVRLSGAVPVHVAMPTWTAESLTKSLREKITPKTKAIIFSNPHNPTGRVYQRTELEQISEISQEHNLLVLVDEVLEYLNYEKDPHISIGSIDGMAERTVTFNGFSKSYSMAGWRVGYLAGPRPLVNNMLKIHQHAVTCANAFSQKGAVMAILGPQDGRLKIKKDLLTRRNILAKELDQIPGVQCDLPEAGLFCFPNVSGLGVSDKEFGKLCLEQAQVAVLPGSLFGTGGEGHARIAFGKRSVDSLREATKRITIAVTRM
jgi:aspartate aminotransferase